MATPAKKQRGRPVVPDDQRRDRTIRVRATADEEAKFEALGGAEWFRKRLQSARTEAAAKLTAKRTQPRKRKP